MGVERRYIYAYKLKLKGMNFLSQTSYISADPEFTDIYLDGNFP